MWIKLLVLGVLGLIFGVSVAGGVFALIIKVGVVPRLSGFTDTAKHVFLYEDSILLGGIAGTVLTVFPVSLHVGVIGLFIYGLFSGLFLGCLSVALAEILDVIPIIMRRIDLKKGIGFVILSMALGKVFGSLLYFYKHWGV